MDGLSPLEAAAPVVSDFGGQGVRTGDGVGAALRPHTTDLTERLAPTGHFLAEEAPEWFLKTLDAFLS